MNDEDCKRFLEDFKKADVARKVDMWFYAVEQAAIWEELLGEMSAIAQAAQPKKSLAEDE
ncbi:MAG: hypothetical protein QXL17_02015 [Candidatus Thermoplasmatota archaeon]